MSKCEICGTDATLSCGACRNATYCSKQHQKQHWPKHKNSCMPFKIEDDSDVGRRLISTRMIKQGELVFSEAPIVSGPSQTTGPVCLGCHNALEMAHYTCSLCGWPLCSEQCQKSPNHVPECIWAQTKRKKKVKISNFVVPHPTYGCILALRCLYQKELSPGNWTKLKSLQAHTKERKDTEKYESDRFSVAQLLRTFYCLQDDFTEDEILEICGIIQINSHEVPLSEPRFVSLFWRGSLLEHSCRPNLSKSFTSEGRLLLRAAQDIPANTSLTICYTDPLWSTQPRRLHLFHTKYFKCTCPRCSDPTEFGSYFSAVNCLTTENCNGKMVPDSFLKDSGSEWRCNKCNGEATQETILRLLNEKAKKLTQVSKQDVEDLEDYIAETIKELPVNHQFVTETGLALVQLYGQQSGGLTQLTEERLNNKQQLAEKLLQLTQLLAPGECRLRGVLWFELHAALAEKARRDPENSRTLLTESGRCLEETMELLKMEPDPLPEKAIYKQACQNYQDLQRLLVQTHIDIPL